MTLVDCRTRVAMRNILLATDFSQPSEHALPYALSIARHYDSRVFLVHVIRNDLFQIVPPEDSAGLVGQARSHAESEMAQLLVSGRLRGIPHQVVLEQGDLWAIMDDSIRNHQIDLIVVGTHGRTGARKLLMGSCAEEIFRLSPCPVLTVGPRVDRRPPAEAHPQSILFATDFSTQSEKAAAYAFSLAQEHAAHLTILHAVEDLGAASDSNKAVLRDFATRRLRQLLPEGIEDWCEPQLVVVFGPPAESILALETEAQADLIVLGIRRSAAFPGHLPPATAYNVVCRAHCPVLTVRG